ncbi:MAG: energy transducer TonB [Pseudomonadota bacterium]
MTVVDFHATDDNGRRRNLVEIAVRRLAVPFALGALATIISLWIMQALITSQKADIKEVKSFNLVDFIRTPTPPSLQVKKRTAEKPPMPDEPPPINDRVEFNVSAEVDGTAWITKDVDLTAQTDMSNAFSFVSDGEYLPIVKVQPMYPTTARVRGEEGWVVLQFTVDETGRVRDPVVIDHCAHVVPEGKREECWDQPSKVFDSAAINATKKFKFKPKVQDGVAVATYNVRHKFTFELAGEE